MLNSKKSFLSLVAVAAFLASFAKPTYAIEPSAGATVVNRRSLTDQNGAYFMNGANDLGYKVWVSTDANPHMITDEAGNVAVSGLIHQVCVSSGTAGEWAVVYDSNTVGSLTVANAATNAGLNLHAPIVRVTTAITCAPVALDAQFNNGAVVLQSGVTLGGTAYIYWRPARGGSN